MSIYKSSALACTVLCGVMFAGGANAQQAVVASYAAKFSCGSPAHDAQAVVAGDYATSINIHNPNPVPVVFDKEFVFALEEGVKPCTTNFVARETLAAGSAERVDCTLINKYVRQCFGLLAPVHVEGFVAVSYSTSCLDTNCGRVFNPLDVVGYYSSRTSSATSSFSSPSVDVVVYPVQLTFSGVL
jgi:hypothetical protein